MIGDVLDGLAAGDSAAAERQVKQRVGRALRALPDLRLSLYLFIESISSLRMSALLATSLPSLQANFLPRNPQASTETGMAPG